MRSLQVSIALTLLAVAATSLADESSKGTASPIHVTIDGSKTGPPINPFIYGQFIEHLGRCIYGGIWAEMLEDRKFYFPISDEYRPYRDLIDTKYPVVGASPWEIVGDEHGVTMNHRNPIVADKPFVGEESPRVADGSGIRQNDLGLVKGRKYDGYIWLRSEGGDATVVVSLISGSDQARIAKSTIKVSSSGASGNSYSRYAFQFESGTTTDKGKLEIRVTGNPVYIGTVSLMPADNIRGMRADTLALLKQLNASIYRWPGGNFVSGYNWRDGIGPRDRRPPRKNPAWAGVEHNDFGIDEFLDFCREIHAEPMIAANSGFGDDYSAAQEVEYANGAADSIGGQWRVKNGHRESFKVKYWCIGNEMWGPWQLGYMQLAQYTQKHNLFAGAMRGVDPSLVLIGTGDLKTKSNIGGPRKRHEVSWSLGMLEECSDSMDLISEHFYSNQRLDDIPAHVAQVVDAIRGKAEEHRRMQAELKERDPDFQHTIPITMDEWNYWFHKYEYGELGCVYQLRDALGIAAGLHEYFRNSDIIQMANYAQTVNVIGCIKTTKTAAFLEPTALPLLLYRREFGTLPLVVTGNQSDRKLDVVAAKTKDGRAITIGVVNPQPNSQTVGVKFKGAKPGAAATVWRIAGSNPALYNTADKQDVAIAEERDVSFGEQLIVPAYSVSLYRVPIE